MAATGAFSLDKQPGHSQDTEKRTAKVPAFRIYGV